MDFNMISKICFTNMNTGVIPGMDEDKTYYETKVSSQPASSANFPSTKNNTSTIFRSSLAFVFWSSDFFHIPNFRNTYYCPHIIVIIIIPLITVR